MRRQPVAHRPPASPRLRPLTVGAAHLADPRHWPRIASDAEILRARAAARRRRARRNPSLAALLAALLPGAGQLYAGDRANARKAQLGMLAPLLLELPFGLLVVSGPLLPMLRQPDDPSFAIVVALTALLGLLTVVAVSLQVDTYIWSIVEAHRAARRANLSLSAGAGLARA